MTLLRVAALFATAAGAVLSIGLFLGQAQRTPLVVVVGFIVWILSPFALLAWAIVRSARWPVAARGILYGVAIVITLASIAIYGRAIEVAPRGSANAFRFVAVAPVSWLLTAIVVLLAARGARRYG